MFTGNVRKEKAKRVTRWGEYRRFYEYKCDHCEALFERDGQRHGKAVTQKESGYQRNLDFCSKACSNAYRQGDKHPRWTGGRSITDGYVMLTVPKGTLGAWNNKSNGVWRITEHILVMQQHLGRPLHDNEEVHHKNGIRDDNRIENLELRCSPHGSGATSYTEEVNRLLAENAALRRELGR